MQKAQYIKTKSEQFAARLGQLVKTVTRELERQVKAGKDPREVAEWLRDDLAGRGVSKIAAADIVRLAVHNSATDLGLDGYSDQERIAMMGRILKNLTPSP